MHVVIVYEMCHKMPPPLNNRCFATLVASARTTSPDRGFVVVQVPVDIAAVPASLYSSGRNKTEGADALKKQKVVMGQYVSIERVRLLPEEGSPGVVEWEMATASDARGSLPMGLQKMGVPGAIVKDVGFFLGWNEKRRGQE